jgi:protein-S-isoprenylcysteine O-methyltransferase Ste14
MFKTLTIICWAIFILFWMISSAQAKHNVKQAGRRVSPLVIFFALTVMLTLIVRATGLNRLIHYQLLPNTIIVQTIGLLLCAAGIAFAIWARIHLGINWGMPMAIKDQPDLVTTGPYAFIRHPIYTGISLAMLSSMFTADISRVIWFVVFTGYFIYSAKQEEKRMLLLFPGEYPGYMKRTKMFIPFIY